MNNERCTSWRRAWVERNKGNKYSLTCSPCAPDRGRVDFSESSCEDEEALLVTYKLKGSDNSNSRNEHGSESAPQVKEVRNSNDSDSTVLILDDKIPLSLLVVVALNEVMSFSAGLLVSYTAAWGKPQRFRPNKHSRGRECSVHKYFKLSSFFLTSGAHFLGDGKCGMC